MRDLRKRKLKVMIDKIIEIWTITCFSKNKKIKLRKKNRTLWVLDPKQKKQVLLITSPL